MKSRTVLTIRELRLDTIIGFYPEERQKKQPVVINISFQVEEPQAVANDDVSYTVNYAELAEEIHKKVSKSSFNLLEKLASFIAEIVMKHKKIKWAEIEILKPEAPLANTKGSAVKMTVER